MATALFWITISSPPARENGASLATNSPLLLSNQTPEFRIDMMVIETFQMAGIDKSIQFNIREKQSLYTSLVSGSDILAVSLDHLNSVEPPASVVEISA